MGDLNRMTAQTYETGVRDIRNDLLAYAKNALIKLGAIPCFDCDGNLPISFFKDLDYLKRNHGYLLRQMKNWESLAEQVNKR